MKYFQVFKTSWEDGFVYRLNFIMWRVRSLMRLLLVYFLWSAVFSKSESLLGYSRAAMLTYILGASLLQALVLGSRSVDVGADISSGDFSNYLLKPLHYFRYWLARDLADKLLNLIFIILELALVIWWLRPPIIFPPSLGAFLLALAAAILATLLYFYLSFLVSAITFWYAEHGGWPARFLFQMLLDFIAGGLFPLDILPLWFLPMILLLPTSYLLFFPLQLWLGKLEGQYIFFGFGMILIWLWLLRRLLQKIWGKGLRVYEAYGR